MAFSFGLNQEQEDLKRQARGFAARELAPRAKEIDEKDEFPWDLWKKMSEPPYRYTGLFIPEEYEGAPRSIMDVCVIIEELTAVGGMALAGALIEACGLSTTAVVRGGNAEQKRKYLTPLARGEAMGCFALTEPGAGSDAAAIETRSELAANKYVLNGRKRYASFASSASFIVVFAKTDPAAGARGISAFLVEPGTPGFSILEKIRCIGMHGHQDEELLFKDCCIPKENLLGREGEGLKIGLATLDETRITLSAGFVGLARAALEDAIAYARERHTFGQPLFEYQAISFPLTEIAIELEAARLLIYRAAWLADSKVRHTTETAAAKAFASQVLLRATDMAIEVHGGFGCTERFSVERYLRDARIWVFAQGAPNIQKLIVSRELFKDRNGQLPLTSKTPK